MKRADALKLARAASELIAAKGKKVVRVNLKKDKPDDDQLAGLMLGPTGNLRAPTIRAGRKVIVGFNQDVYESVFG